MIIEQISVFAENVPGTLAEILAVLQEHAINLRALSVADTADFGILRLIVLETEKAQRILRDAGFTVKISPVLTLAIEDHPGGLLPAIQKISAAGINIEYLYAFATDTMNAARVVIKVDQPEQALHALGEEEKTSKDHGSTTGPATSW